MNNQYKVLANQYENKPKSYYGSFREEMMDFIPLAAKKILDVGCGEGGFGKNIKARFPGREVWGIEPDKASASIAGSVLDKVVNSIFDDNIYEIKGEKFNCIVFNDVLEHLINPDNALRSCHQYLEKEGTILASIPSILYFPVIWGILTKQDWKYQQHGTLDNTHLRFFTKKSIVRMFEENGYEIIKITGINPFRPSRTYRILNTVLFGKLKDWRYQQFAVLAKRKIENGAEQQNVSNTNRGNI